MSPVLHLVRDVLLEPRRAIATIREGEHDLHVLLLWLWAVVASAIASAVAGTGYPLGMAAALLGGLLSSAVTLLCATALLHLSAGLLDGDGRVKDLLRGCALATVPLILAPSFALAGTTAHTLAQLALAAWQLVLVVVVVREVYRLSVSTAILAVLAPVFALLVLLPLAGLFVLGLALLSFA